MSNHLKPKAREPGFVDRIRRYAGALPAEAAEGLRNLAAEDRVEIEHQHV